MDKPAASLGAQSQSSSSGSGSLNTASGPPGSSTSTVPVSPVMQSAAAPLLQDPTLLRQLLPALQTALQLNNASVDMAKINEGKRLGSIMSIRVFYISSSFFPLSSLSVYIQTELLVVVCFSMHWFSHFKGKHILTCLVLLFNPVSVQSCLEKCLWFESTTLHRNGPLYSHTCPFKLCSVLHYDGC